MSQLESSDEAPAASLVGSLSVFTLSDVLTMLASTAQTGELQVVSETASTEGVARPAASSPTPRSERPRPSARPSSNWPA